MDMKHPLQEAVGLCSPAKAPAGDVLHIAGRSGAECLVKTWSEAERVSLDGAEWKRRIEPRRAARPRGERPAENFGTCPEDDRPAAAARLAKLWATAKVVEAVEGEPVPEVLGRRRRRRMRRRLFGRGRMAVVRSPSDREHTTIPWSARDLSSGAPT